MRRKNRKSIFRLLVILIAAFAIFTVVSKKGVPGWVKNTYDKTTEIVSEVIETNNSKNTSNTKKVIVSYVIDGDTFNFVIDGQKEKVRLIGVDTPESAATGGNAYKNCKEGKKASKFTKKMIENKKVKLETDVSERDKYGRILAYVYLEDGRMLNELLLKKGYARVMTIEPNVSHSKDFEKIEKQAKENKVGFWNKKQSPWY